MNKKIKVLLLAFSSIGISSYARSPEEMPPISSLYASNLVDIEVCKKLKINVKPMDQKKVLQEYIKIAGSQEHFVDDVRFFTGKEFEYRQALSPEKTLDYCKNIVATQAAIAKLEESFKNPKSSDKAVNPLDTPVTTNKSK